MFPLLLLQIVSAVDIFTATNHKLITSSCEKYDGKVIQNTGGDLNKLIVTCNGENIEFGGKGGVEVANDFAGKNVFVEADSFTVNNLAIREDGSFPWDNVRTISGLVRDDRSYDLVLNLWIGLEGEARSRQFGSHMDFLRLECERDAFVTGLKVQRIDGFISTIAIKCSDRSENSIPLGSVIRSPDGVTEFVSEKGFSGALVNMAPFLENIRLIKSDETGFFESPVVSYAAGKYLKGFKALYWNWDKKFYYFELFYTSGNVTGIGSNGMPLNITTQSA